MDRRKKTIGLWQAGRTMGRGITVAGHQGFLSHRLIQVFLGLQFLSCYPFVTSKLRSAMRIVNIFRSPDKTHNVHEYVSCPRDIIEI